MYVCVCVYVFTFYFHLLKASVLMVLNVGALEVSLADFVLNS